MTHLLQKYVATGPALWLVLGRGIGFAATFAVPLVLVRYFDQSTFGTYKQVFVVFATLYGIAQLGVAESLYYFVPRSPAQAGRHASNAFLTLSAIGTLCGGAVVLAARPLSIWLGNAELEALLLPGGIFLALMLASAAFEVVLVARNRYRTAASVYAATDIARAAFILVPAAAIGSLRAVLWGTVACAGLRLAAMCVVFWRAFGSELRPNLQLWRGQWIYTLPFAVAVGVDVLQTNVHFYAVASRFDAALFAVYAVGCLQVPLVDVLMTSSANVMMVKMAENGFNSRGPSALALWHDTTRRLAFLIIPLVVFLIVMARDIILILFTGRYVESVPVFMLWTCTLLFAIPCVDAMLRAHSDTRFLVWLNVLRLVTLLALVFPAMQLLGLPGAALAVLLSTALARGAGLARIARQMGVRLTDALPWRDMAATTLVALVAAAPAVWIAHAFTMPRPLALVCAMGIYGMSYVLGSSLVRDITDSRHVRHRWNHQVGR